MLRLPPSSTRPDSLILYTTLFRSLPAPIVEERLQSDEGFGVRRIAEFVGIAGDRLSPHCAAGILTLDAMRLDVLCAHLAQGSAQLDLLVAPRGRRHARRRPHRADRAQLEHLGLHG